MGHLTERKEWTLAELCAMPDCREAAEKSGGQFYYTGESCKRGHYMSPRLTNSTACVECKREAQDKYRKSGKGRSTACRVTRRIYHDNPELARTRERVKYYQKQLDKNLGELSDLLRETDT